MYVLRPCKMTQNLFRSHDIAVAFVIFDPNRTVNSRSLKPCRIRLRFMSKKKISYKRLSTYTKLIRQTKPRTNCKFRYIYFFQNLLFEVLFQDNLEWGASVSQDENVCNPAPFQKYQVAYQLR